VHREKSNIDLTKLNCGTVPIAYARLSTSSNKDCAASSLLRIHPNTMSNGHWASAFS
jgi:hypothetical protein